MTRQRLRLGTIPRAGASFVGEYHDRILRMSNKALAVPSVHDIARRNGGEIIGPSTPAEAAAFAAKERAQWVPIVRAMNIAH